MSFNKLNGRASSLECRWLQVWFLLSPFYSTKPPSPLSFHANSALSINKNTMVYQESRRLDTVCVSLCFNTQSASHSSSYGPCLVPLRMIQARNSNQGWEIFSGGCTRTFVTSIFSTSLSGCVWVIHHGTPQVCHHSNRSLAKYTPPTGSGFTVMTLRLYQ